MTAVDPAWPCLSAGCERAEDCADALGGPCGWVGPDDFEPPVREFTDGVPLPEPPEDEDVEPEPWDPQPIRVEEIPDDLPVVIIRTDEEVRRSREVYEVARRVHVAPAPADRMYRRLGEEFDPRGRHVGCDGEPGATERMSAHCGVPPGVACRPPNGRLIPGFVHPSRLASEMMLYGIDSSTVTV